MAISQLLASGDKNVRQKGGGMGESCHKKVLNYQQKNPPKPCIIF